MNFTTDAVPASGNYYYVIVAENAYGNSSSSNCENITVSFRGPVPDPPILLQPISANLTVFLNWMEVPDAIGYYIYRALTEITNVARLVPILTSSVNFTTDMVPASGNYYYVIVVENAYGNSSPSNCENITVRVLTDGTKGGKGIHWWVWVALGGGLVLIVGILIIHRKKKAGA